MPPVLHVAAIHANAPSIEAPRFIVGQDPEGHWVAIETHGRAGGLFRSRQAAVDYAEDETAHRPDGVFVSGERIEFRL
ncbi:hypothetical protein SAMN04487843_12679 [Methylobacterium sp. ap11]|jgi:hypothetical protein|uniref:hypothetical protein n=1 Tax=Methylobacterium sp. ap11 TaxID=1761799 RepID=UPI0008B946B1|nr:hypothetical protein [Methylobacterium sp. ap11]SEP48197.1 hypothetical protein SAMN04487843_12679 [Methylobacterium sp. ap11]